MFLHFHRSLSIQASHSPAHEHGSKHHTVRQPPRSAGSELPPDALPHLLFRSKRRLPSIHSPIHTSEYENDTECRPIHLPAQFRSLPYACTLRPFRPELRLLLLSASLYPVYAFCILHVLPLLFQSP